MAIVNQRPENSIVGQLERANFSFFLTGSRFFGGVTPTSDWDYFVQDSDELRDFLYELGFHMLENDTPNSHYGDSSVVCIYQLNDIHIQAVKDATLKARVQDYLSHSCEMRNIPKVARRYVWNLAFKAVEQMINSYIRMS